MPNNNLDIMIHPLTQKKIKLNSIEAKLLLKQYIYNFYNFQSGGMKNGGPSTTLNPGWSIAPQVSSKKSRKRGASDSDSFSHNNRRMRRNEFTWLSYKSRNKKIKPTTGIRDDQQISTKQSPNNP